MTGPQNAGAGVGAVRHGGRPCPLKSRRNRSSTHRLEQRTARRSEASPAAQRGRAIRVRLQMKPRKRDLALFNLAIDSKLRGCDLVSLRVDDIAAGGRVRPGDDHPAQDGPAGSVEIMEQTRASLQEWLNVRPADRGPYVFPSRVHDQPHLTARQYARIVHGWVDSAGMDSTAYGTHSLRRTTTARSPQDRQFASGPATSRTYEDREYGPLSRDRGRRCAEPV